MIPGLIVPPAATVRPIAQHHLGRVDGIEQTGRGRSTWVYRVIRGSEEFYLRIWPEPGESFGPEALVHTLLRERGVHVPDVVSWEDEDPMIGRSVMLTRALPGRSLADSADERTAGEIARQAGVELATIATIPVASFSWIVRTPRAETLCGEMTTNAAFMLSGLEQDVQVLRAAERLRPTETHTILAIVADHASWLDIPSAHLVHGDLDATHVYAAGGRYTGIIDFGEIRGADPLYDLGHFRLHDGEHVPMDLLSPLLDGYRSVRQLPPDVEYRIAFFSLLIGIHLLAPRLQRLGHETQVHVLQSLRRDIALLCA